MFPNSPNLSLDQAQPGTFSLRPSEEMITLLRADYEAMACMIFGRIPDFDTVLASTAALETELIASASW